MQSACLLRLGDLSRLLPVRHSHSGQFLLPHATFRTSHGLSKKRMGVLEEVHEEHGQRRFRRVMTDFQIHGKISTSRLDRAKRTQGKPPRPPSKSSSGRALHKSALPPLVETNSAFKPRDMRVQFVKEFDKLEDDSQELARIICRFSQIEKHQRYRLGMYSAEQDRENSLSRFIAWKSAIKGFNPESNRSKPVSMEEARYVHWIEQCTTLEEMISCWPSPPAKMRKVHKDSSLALITTAVRYVPDKLHLVFEAALSSPYGQPHWYVVEDVLELLAGRLRVIGLEKVKALAAQNMANMAVQILKTRRRDTVHFTQFTIRSILDALPADFVKPWYLQLLDAGCDLHPFTEVRFASRLAKSSPTKALSAEVLIRLQDAKLLHINTPVAASVVTTILSFSKEDLVKLDKNSATPAELFRDLHSAGLIPNVITYTTIIRGLCLKQDLETALDVFEVMQQHGVEPNEWTYAVLLHGCKMRNNWTALADVAVQACHAKIRNIVVWNEVLHAIYICCLKHHVDGVPKRASLFALNSIYSRIFDAMPVRPFITGRLAEIGEHVGQQQHFPEPLRRLTTEIPALPPRELRSPGPDTLCILLMGLIRALPSPYDVVVFYSQYRQMLRQGHPVAKLMVQERGSFVHDIVLRNLLKWPGTLRFALDIIRDMMKDVESESEPSMTAPSISGAESPQILEEDAHADVQSSSEARPSPIPHPTPSKYTWTVLVHGFMKAKQPQDAEYIMTLMRSHGIEPNLVTWNTLAAGYARLQKIPEAVNAMRRLEAEGHEADDWTMRAFSYIRNKAKAIELMEATVAANQAHKTAANLQHEDQGGVPSPDERAADDKDAVGQLPQGTDVDHWPQQYEEAHEQADRLLDRELEAGLGISLDTLLDEDIDMDGDKLEPEDSLVDLSKRTT